MAPPKDIARSYPKRGITADVGFRSEPKFCGDGSTEFDGSSDFATATTYDGGGTETTMVYWIKADSTAGTTMPFANGGASNSRNQLQTLITSGTLRAADAPTNIPFSIDANRWYMLAIIGDSGGLKKAYLDGIDGGSPVSYGHSITATSLTLGARSTGPTQPFNGKLARFRIFNVELTQDQIRELYNNPGLEVPTGLTSSNLRRNYRLETDFNDSGADSENATASGSPSFTVDRPQLPRGLDLARGAAMARVYTGRAVDFDGGADGLASTATLNINTSGAKATLACWVNPDVSTTGNKTIVSNAIDTNNNQFTIYQNGASYAVSAVYASGFTKVNYFADSQVKVGAWTFLCAVWDFDTTSLTFYVDGVSFTDTPSTAIGSTNGVFEIGCRDPSGSKSQLFDGQIASIKLFDTTLTQAQVRELYHNPEQVLPTGVSASNLRRYYPLSDYNDTGGTGGRYFQDMGADGEPAEDKGSANMLFAQPVPCPQLGLQQSATRLYYDGTTGTTYNVEVTGHPLNEASFSIAFWGFFQSNNPNTTSCCFDTSGGGTFQYFINSTAGNLTVYNGAPTATFNGVVPRDEWVHVVITGHDSSPYIKCYVNGAEQTIDSGSASTAGLVATNYYLFSRSANSLSHTGFGDNYSIYDSNLGASEVLELYNQGIGYDPRTNVGNYTSASNLIRLYKFDDLTTVKDYSGNNAHADVNGTFKAASFPENASGSTIVGDFSLKRKGVSVLNPTATPAVTSDLIRAEIANDGSLNPNPTNGGYTASVFIRLEQQDIGGGTWVPMILGNSNVVSSLNYLLFYFPGTNASVPIRLNIGDGTVTNRSYNYPSALPNPEEWHQVAFTIDFSTSPTTFRLYQDGALVSTQATNNHSASDLGDLSVGAYWSGNGNFPGAIACVKIYQTKLSDNEIEQIYRSDLRLIKGLENE